MKRQIDEDLINVWATMVSEEIDKLQEIQNTCQQKLQYLYEGHPDWQKKMDTYRLAEAKISAFAKSLAIFSGLEEGKFQSKYDEIVTKINEEKEMQEVER